MHFSCKSCYLPEGWGENEEIGFSRRETLNGRTIDDMGANVETRDFRTCSRACLCDSRNPAPPTLELSLLPVKRRAELKSAFRNCAPSRKHPQRKRNANTSMLNAWTYRKTEITKVQNSALREMRILRIEILRI